MPRQLEPGGPYMAPYEPRSRSSGGISGGAARAQTVRYALTGPRRFETPAGFNPQRARSGPLWLVIEVYAGD